MKIPKTAKKAIENSKLMYELIYQEKLIDEQFKICNFPPSFNQQILKFWHQITGDTDFLIKELTAMDKANFQHCSREEFKNNQRYFLTSLILHDKIVNKDKLKLDGKL